MLAPTLLEPKKESPVKPAVSALTLRERYLMMESRCKTSFNGGLRRLLDTIPPKSQLKDFSSYRMTVVSAGGATSPALTLFMVVGQALHDAMSAEPHQISAEVFAVCREAHPSHPAIAVISAWVEKTQEIPLLEKPKGGC